MTTQIPYIEMRKGKTMAMEDLLDMLQTARERSGIVGITQQPKEKQAQILKSLMHKFDAKKDTQTVIDNKWGLDSEDMNIDSGAEVNVLECRKKIK